MIPRSAKLKGSQARGQNSRLGSHGSSYFLHVTSSMFASRWHQEERCLRQELQDAQQQESSLLKALQQKARSVNERNQKLREETGPRARARANQGLF